MARENDEKQKKDVHLEWKDYAAIVIAAFETTLLPFLILVVVLVFMLLVLRR